VKLTRNEKEFVADLREHTTLSKKQIEQFMVVLDKKFILIRHFMEEQ